MSLRILFIGSGRMSGAIVTGLIRSEVSKVSDIYCYSKSGESSKRLSEALGVQFVPSLNDLDSKAYDMVVIGCKPYQVGDLEPEVYEKASGKMVISLLAGTTVETLTSLFSSASSIVRTMPNTPGQIGEGVTAYCSAKTLPDQEVASIEKLLGALGVCRSVEENQMDAVTALSGSGPAYVFEFTSALIEGAKVNGLSDEVSYELAVQTVLGAAQLMKQKKVDPQVLRDEVTSPGGTTEAALGMFADGNLRELVTSAVTRAKERSIELSKKS